MRMVVDSLRVGNLSVLGPGQGSAPVSHDEMRSLEELRDRLGALGNRSHRECSDLLDPVPDDNTDLGAVGQSRIERVVLLLEPDVDAEANLDAGIRGRGVCGLRVSDDD